jgi:alpha-L-rhamnosidase
LETDAGDSTRPTDSFARADWIWSARPVADKERVLFRKELQLPAGRQVTKAILRTTADNTFECFLNGGSVLKGDNWKKPRSADLAAKLLPGRNLIAFEVTNQDHQAGLIAALDIEFDDGTTLAVISDETWQVLAAPSEGWKLATASPEGATAARVIGKNGVQPWGEVKSPPAPRAYPPATFLRNDFQLAARPARALLHVTALGHIEPRLNGRPVSDEYFTPGWSDYKKRLYYRTYDVTDRLRKGSNTLGAILGDGWFRGQIGLRSPDFYGKHTRARMELQLFDAAGRETKVATDATWKASNGPILRAEMLAGEIYDARLELTGWDKPGYDAAGWSPVATGAEFEPAVIEPHPAEPVRAMQQLPTLAITEPRPGVYVFDLGQNFAGWARLKVKEKAGTRVVLRFAEMLNADGTIYTANLRSALATDTYITRGGGTEIWEPRFTYHGFRYVEVTGLSDTPKPSMITGIVAHTDLADTGAFESSDPLINQIYKNTLWGQRSNYLEIPTDCPQRDERLGWSGDTQVFARTGLYNMRAERFLAKWLRDLGDGQTPEGAFPNVAPDVIGGWSPAWADAGVIVPHELWRATGDTAVLRQNYAAMKKHVAFHQKSAPKLIGPNRGYGDWLAIGPSTPKPLISTAYFAHSAALLSEMAAALGETADAATYEELSGRVRVAFQKEFVAADGKIGSGSMTCYLLALRYDLLPLERRADAAQRLVDAIEKNPEHLCGFVGIGHLLPVLTQIGRTDLAYKLLQKRTYPSWGYSIDQGATTIWERWNSYTKADGFGPVNMNSFNHYAYGACVEWLYTDVLGIQPAEPGYGKILIRARPGGGLTSAKGHYDSLRGRIISEWTIEDGRFRQTVVIPEGTTATICVPAKDVATVKEGRTSAAKSCRLTFLRVEAGYAIYAVPAGRYVFTSSL